MTEAVNSLDDFDLRTYAESIRNYDDRFLVQRRIVGTEHTCGVICQEGKYHALPVARIQNTSQFLGYKEKTSKGSYEVVFPDEKSVLCHRIQKISERIAKLFDVHTFCRLDFIVDDQERIFFFELNIVPGLTAGSIFPKMMARAGLDVMDLIPIAFENEDIRHKRELQRKRATSEIRYGKVLVQ
jgi:D-alanine-D-alanine ligase